VTATGGCAGNGGSGRGSTTTTWRPQPPPSPVEAAHERERVSRPCRARQIGSCIEYVCPPPPWTSARRRRTERHRRPSRAPLAPHQPRPARDAPHSLERRVHEGARIAVPDRARCATRIIVLYVSS